jgi:hypothetical protein
LGDKDLLGQPIKGYNTFDNTIFNVYQNVSGPTIKAINNYWGCDSIDTYCIESKLRGPVTYDPPLDSDPVTYLARTVEEAITTVKLYQNYPNPLRGGNSTNIKFSLPRAQKVTIRVYDVAGRRVKTLVDGVKQAGHHYITWDGKNDRGSRVATGIYFYQMKYSDKVLSKKIVLIR